MNFNFREYTFFASTGQAYFDKFPTDNLMLSLPWDTTLFIKVIWFNHTQGQPLDYVCNLCNLALESNAQLSTDRVTIKHGTIHYGLLYYVLWVHNINGLMQERHNSIANALHLRLPCTNLSIWAGGY